MAEPVLSIEVCIESTGDAAWGGTVRFITVDAERDRVMGLVELALRGTTLFTLLAELGRRWRVTLTPVDAETRQ